MSEWCLTCGLFSWYKRMPELPLQSFVNTPSNWLVIIYLHFKKNSTQCWILPAFCLNFQTEFSYSFDTFYGIFWPKLNILSCLWSIFDKNVSILAKIHNAKKPARNNTWDKFFPYCPNLALLKMIFGQNKAF